MRCLITLFSVILFFFPAFAVSPASEPQGTFYVAVDGKDSNSGTLDAPVASLARAIQLAERNPEPAAVVVRGGTYFLENTVMVRRSVKKSRLLIRAADGESVIFDGSVPLGEAEPLEGVPDVYTVNGDFGAGDREPPPIWDETGRHFRKLSSLEAVSATDYSNVLLDERTMAFRYIKDISPSGAGLRTNRRGVVSGIRILRDNVTVQGIEFRNFISIRSASGIIIGDTGKVTSGEKGRGRKGVFTENAVIDSCRTWNCFYGFHVYINSRNALITRCKVRNCSTGIWVSGIDTVVEHCELVNDPDWHSDKLTWDGDSSRRGISFYNGPEDAVIRHNLIKNFRIGIFSKGSPGRYIVENNTVLNGFNALSPDAGFRVQYNIFAGFDLPFRSDLKGELEALIDNNLFWGRRDLSGIIRDESMGGAPNNVFGDPLFASPDKGDYRLLPGSPALEIGGVKNVGAYPRVPEEYRGPPNLRVTPGRRRENDITVNLAVTSATPVVATICVINGGPSVEREFSTTETFELPERESEHEMVFRVRDANGSWSGDVTLKIPATAEDLRMEGEPIVITSRYGALFSFNANGNVPGRVEYLDGEKWVDAGICHFLNGRANPLLVIPPLPGSLYRYRLKVGRNVREGAFILKGSPRIMYVSVNGEDIDTAGSREKPFRTIQFALDRALPGDRVRIMPGVYFGAYSLRHGGTAENPLIIEGLYPNTVTLDGLREAGTLLVMEKASHVILRNLNFQWYRNSAVSVRYSENVHVVSCRFRNHYWRGASGVVCRSLVISNSPGFAVEKSIFCRTRYGIEVYNSSGGRIVNNTFLANVVTHILWRGRPDEDITIMYNSLNWNGNQMLNIGQPRDTVRARSRIDYNNYGTTFQYPEGTERSGGRYGASLELPFPYLPTNREFTAGARTFANMSDWQEYSGQDRNSIFADPKWINPEKGRFDVAAGSPNILPDGKVIGALGYLGENPNMDPEIVLVSPCNGEEVKGAFALESHASDFDGSVVLVEFYAGGKLIAKSDVLPYRVPKAALAPGRYAITARAIDNRGGETVSDKVTVTVIE